MNGGVIGSDGNKVTDFEKFYAKKPANPDNPDDPGNSGEPNNPNNPEVKSPLEAPARLNETQLSASQNVKVTIIKLRQWRRIQNIIVL